MKWHIFFIMWISGSWKWTLIKNLQKLNLKNVHFPLSYRTRKIREWEVNWRDSYFISKEDFIIWIENKEFLEYAIVHWTDYYWTKYEDVIDNWINKWKIVIKEIDILWLKRLKKERPKFSKYYSTVFLNIPTCILKERLESRWVLMSNEEFKRRQESAFNEEKEISKICDFEIDATLNTDLIVKRFLKILETFI